MPTYLLGVALAFVFSGQAVAVEAPLPPDPPHPVFHSVPKMNPDELKRALQSDNPAEAKRAFGGNSCVPNDEAAEVVRHAWESRDSAGASGAEKDPVVRTLMAKCLAEYKPRFTPLEAADAPVLAQLRLALASNDLDRVQAAAFGLTPIASVEDVKAMVGAAMRLPSLKVPIVDALSQVCRVDAIAAGETVRSSATDERQIKAIENVQAHSAKLRRIYCGFDANIVPNGVSQADIDDFLSTSAAEPDRNLGDLKGILGATKVQDARGALLKLRCAHENEETLSLVKAAWAGRDIGASALVTHDPTVRVLLAKCLANASDPAKVPAAVKAESRKAVRDSNNFDFVLGVEGLARIAAPKDIRLIRDSVKGRPATIAVVVVQTLMHSCSPESLEAVTEIRNSTASPKAAREMDYAMGVTKRMRAVVCKDDR